MKYRSRLCMVATPESCARQRFTTLPRKSCTVHAYAPTAAVAAQSTGFQTPPRRFHLGSKIVVRPDTKLQAVQVYDGESEKETNQLLLPKRCSQTPSPPERSLPESPLDVVRARARGVPERSRAWDGVVEPVTPLTPFTTREGKRRTGDRWKWGRGALVCARLI